MAPSATPNGTSTAINGHPPPVVPRRLFSLKEPPSLSTLQKLTSLTTSHATYPLAETATSNIPIYNLSTYSPSDSSTTSTLQDEWHHILLSGPGVFILRNFLPSPLITTVNSVYTSITTSEASSSSSKGDHFATAGSNSRIWNSFQKHALLHPSSFVSYYANPWLSHVSSAWLGPAYQITAQVNIVHPGGAPQTCHRDYHLGFQTAEASAEYPIAMHKASALLTLQGAIAHSEMPLLSGPTRFLPFSQLFDGGYMAYRLPEFAAFFEEKCVSLPLEKGDAVFFNPALFHAAGRNTSADIERSANLLQISSAFGRAMESVDTQALIEACWGEVVRMHEKSVSKKKSGDGDKNGGHALSQEVRCAIKAIAEGYPFPTNLDRRPPAPGGMAPESEQEMLVRALGEGWNVQETLRKVKEMRRDSLP